jgi:hypothetical protein
MKDPRGSKQWQEAVDLAAGLRAIADCKMYGLLEGGPEIDIRRCDQILERGALIGYSPSRPVKELAVVIVQAFNSRASSAPESKGCLLRSSESLP